jgi:hypothetical protein
MVPDGGVEDEESHDEGKVGVIQQDDGENGGNLHGPGERVPHVAQVHQERVPRGLRQLVGAILRQPLLNLGT